MREFDAESATRASFPPMSPPLSPASVHAVRFCRRDPKHMSARRPHRAPLEAISLRLSRALGDVEPEQPALLVPVEGDGAAQPVDDQLRRLPVRENGWQ